MNGSSTVEVMVELKYSLTRMGPSDASTVSDNFNRTLTSSDESDLITLEQLYKAVNLDCSDTSSI